MLWFLFGVFHEAVSKLEGFPWVWRKGDLFQIQNTTQWILVYSLEEQALSAFLWSHSLEDTNGPWPNCVRVDVTPSSWLGMEKNAQANQPACFKSRPRPRSIRLCSFRTHPRLRSLYCCQHCHQVKSSPGKPRLPFIVFSADIYLLWSLHFIFEKENSNNE